MTIGREEGNDIEIPWHYSQVSRNHARVYIDKDALILEDLGSNNGTFLNGHRLSDRAPFSLHDEVRFGSYVLNTAELEPYVSGRNAPQTGAAPAAWGRSSGPSRPSPSPPIAAPPPQSAINVAAPQGREERGSTHQAPSTGMAISGGVLAIISGVLMLIGAAVIAEQGGLIRRLYSDAIGIGIAAGTAQVLLGALSCARLAVPCIIGAIVSMVLLVLMASQLPELFDLGRRAGTVQAIGVMIVLLYLLQTIFLFVGFSQCLKHAEWQRNVGERGS